MRVNDRGLHNIPIVDQYCHNYIQLLSATTNGEIKVFFLSPMYCIVKRWDKETFECTGQVPDWTKALDMNWFQAFCHFQPLAKRLI